MKPVDGLSMFGYCENCGIVYALRDRLKEPPGTEAPSGHEARTTVESVRSGDGQARFVDSPRPDRPPGVRWSCPDCDAEIHGDNDTDLQFAKREHIREYHPNRSTG